jgi:hypothetical protein
MRTQMLHSLLDALRDGLAAHREYERLISLGVGHDPALRAAVSQTSHSREACARRTSVQSALLILVAAVGAWIDRRREQKTPARIDAGLLCDTGLTGSEHARAGVKSLSFAGTV